MAQSAYLTLATAYDRLNGGVDYEAWADYMEDCFVRYRQDKVHTVLDLACGTGNMMLTLLRRGYRVHGIDLSADMLAEANRKANEAGFHPLLLCQDMRTFELYAGKRAEADDRVDCVTCCLDSINYLTGAGDLARCFARVRAHLHTGGLFLFDVNTPLKFRTVYGQNDYVLEAEGVVCTWQNDWNEKTRKCHFALSLFLEGRDGRYTRTDEWHTERCYALKTLEKELRKAGFALRECVGDFAHTPVKDTHERAYYAAVAI